MLRFVEGFDFFQSAKLATRGYTVTTSGGGTAAMDVGRQSGPNPSQSLKITCTSGNNEFVRQDFGASLTNLNLGFAFKTSAYRTSGSEEILVCYTAGGATFLFEIDLSTTGAIQFNSSSGVVTSTTVLALNTWYYIELYVNINGSSSTMELHVDGAVALSSRTVTIAAGSFAHLLFNVNDTPASHWYDDLFILDNSTGVSTGFQGPCMVETLMPTADGSSVAWTPSSGTTHFSRVNEISGTFPDDDTTYNSDASNGDRDTYVCADLAGALGYTATILGVQTNIYARNTGTATNIAPVIRQGGTVYDGVSVPTTGSYAWYKQFSDTDPTGAPWTGANVNADEFGVKSLTAATSRVSQIAIEVLHRIDGTATARLSQEAIEALVSPSAGVRLSQEAIEVLRVTAANLASAALSQEALETVIQKILAEAVMSQMVIEVLVHPSKPRFRATLINDPE